MRRIMPEPVRAIACKACDKLMKVVSMPMDASGRASIIFRMTCLKCHHAGTYNVLDVLQMNGRKAG